MRPSPSSQHEITAEIAAEVANFILLNTIGYGVVAARANEPCDPEAMVVLVTKTGHADRTAKVVVHDDRLVYVSRTATHVSFPVCHEDAGRIVAALLSLEDN